MIKKILIDTNVLIDFVCNRTEFYNEAETLFSMGLAGKIKIYFTDISVINTLYVGRKYEYTIEELCNIIQSILNFCEISEIDGEVVLNALTSQWKDKEDATQYFSAIASNIDTIVTRNIKDYNLSNIPVTTPSDFIKQL